MYPGNSKITKKSTLSNELKELFLTAPYFEAKPTSFNLEEYTNFFKWNEPKTDIEHAIITLLDLEDYNYTGKIIEYWFQHQINGQSLAPHCDYNHLIRNESLINSGDWIHTVDKNLVMSPVTIGCYLKVGNMIGGELCISEKDWFDYAEPLKFTANDIENVKSYPYEQYMPRDNDILYFEGSRYFHWINPVIEGERKSMMINFWPEDMEI